jgi:hypothetical protein
VPYITRFSANETVETWYKHMGVTAFPQQPAINATAQTPIPSGMEAESDEYRHRDRENLFAAVAAVLLIAAGWWILSSLV